MDRYKVIILGPANSGKSTILNQIKCSFNPENDIYFPTVGVDLGVKIINFKDKEIKIQFWDTAGQERFDSIINLYYKKADMAFIVFDISDTKNINFSIDSLIEKIDIQSGNIPIILIGNKIDKTIDDDGNTKSKFKIDVNEFDKITKYFEISAKNINDVDDMIDFIIKNEILPYLETKNNTINNSITNLSEENQRIKNIFKYFFILF